MATERIHGKFQRQVLLGEGLDTERLKANYEQGVLTVTIPVAEKAKPRKIDVEITDSHQKSIDAASEPVSTSSN